MTTRSFLVEIGTEELPPKALAALGEAFAVALAAGLEQSRLGCAQVLPYFSPRRLAVLADGVPERQPDVAEQRLGPAIKAAYDADGKPTKAALGFAASCGVDVEALTRVVDGKNERIAAEVTDKGLDAAALLPDIVNKAMGRLPIPKRMRWGVHSAEFVRPVHWVVMLFGDEVVTGEVFGIQAGRASRGHRFHAPGPVEIPSAEQYPAVLAEHAWVRVNDRARSLTAHIREQVEAAARKLGGVALGLDGDLADEVAALVEWPVPVVGGFDEKYLSLPEEVLVTTLMHHQRYFPVRNADGALLPAFVTFANIDSTAPEVVAHGNERVVVPRLEDAMFFWNQDRSVKLADRVPFLDDVTWQKDLGSVGDKARRVGSLAQSIGATLGADASATKRATELAKCDLLTAMVGEFPELQGVMGRYYALNDGEDAAVATAIEEHYLPRFAGDRIASTPLGRTLALADRLDSLAAVFATGARPSGDKDPFALRRAALGVLRTIMDAELDLDLRQLLDDAVSALPPERRSEGLTDELFAFAMERMRALLADDGVAPDVFEAVAAVRPTRPLDFLARVRAVAAFTALPESGALAAADKRIANILRQSDSGGGSVDDTLLAEPAEHALWDALADATRNTKPMFDDGRYTDGLLALAALRDPVDAFFDAVMVMTDDMLVRGNRIALLQQVHGLLHRVADIGLLQRAGG
jgi:glycyl-tRNA synthetase beta chain